ncbi:MULTISPECIES: hypothetical protein [Streptomyces]|uniref:hypothetical protein n=1 Tax=Streptomyces TaxID=1883 RepID=UPI001E4DBFB1|nr:MULTISPECIES: hypothetical protein [Streptomyces]UFQ16421.1 hypothetical protein J2N69_16210 [Streptomyces huasconensis]WCL86024.1 hypothetical protein PPN52_16215 [Streptomyces sp. JCM 35825]
MDIKTWANGELIAPADMKKYVSDALKGFLEPPACRRTMANAGSEQLAPGWHVVKLERPGSGYGAGHSYDTTGGLMSKEQTKIHAPIDGLYEVSAGLIIRAVSGSLPYVVGSVNKNASTGGTIGATGFLRFGHGRATAGEKVGAGSTTIPLKAGEYIAMAFNADAAAYVGEGAYAQMISHLELRWIGVMP